MEEKIQKSALQLGHTALEPEQLEVVSQFIKGKDVFVVLPTGYGKTLCFGVLPLVFNLLRSTNTSIVAVVTPLVSIMQSMAAEYQSRGMRTGYISRGMRNDEIKQGIRQGKYQLVFFTPEALLSSTWRSMLPSPPYQNNLVAFVVDEAHSVYKWLVNNVANHG